MNNRLFRDRDRIGGAGRQPRTAQLCRAEAGLAGIAIEEWKDQGVLVGVRIRLVVAAATELFPELAVALPPIREISVTIQPQ